MSMKGKETMSETRLLWVNLNTHGIRGRLKVFSYTDNVAI